jgi:hypothetical protein
MFLTNSNIPHYRRFKKTRPWRRSKPACLNTPRWVWGIIEDPENRVVQKLQFLNNFRLKQKNAAHFARFVQELIRFLNKSNVYICVYISFYRWQQGA